MQPETSAQYQHRFAQAIREGKAADGLPQERLNVYIRLIRNNIHSFIDRCYTETLQYFDSEEWGRLKEGFVRDVRAQTPYFQEIPGEFLRYCQSLPLSDDLLALMDFEHTQLLADHRLRNVVAHVDQRRFQGIPQPHARRTPLDALLAQADEQVGELGSGQPRGILHDDGPFLMRLLTIFHQPSYLMGSGHHNIDSRKCTQMPTE